VANLSFTSEAVEQFFLDLSLLTKAVRLWWNFYGGGTVGYAVVGYKTPKAVLK